MAETTSQPRVKEYYDYAKNQVDEQAILDKYNAATAAQFAVQREQNRQAENQFYNQMYQTQRTAMDTIRQSNASAVATGASKGVQAAQELSALLGLQQESVASATELANANRQTAQEETAAVLENVLNAYTQAAQERSQLVTQGIEAASVDAQLESSAAQTERANLDALQSAAKEGSAAYLAELANQGRTYNEGYSTEGEQALQLLYNSAIADSTKKDSAFTQRYLNSLENIYGLSTEDLGLTKADLKLLFENGIWNTPKLHKAYLSHITDLARNAYRNRQTQS